MIGVFISQIASAFGGGVLASLSPCVFPLIPITLGYFSTQTKKGKKAGILLYGLGQVVGFVAIGIVAISLGEVFGFTSESPELNLVLGVMLLMFGALSLYGRLPRIFDRWNQYQQNKINHLSESKFSGFILGLSSALLASPCTTPILSSLLVVLATQGTFELGVALMVSYSIGFSALFILLGLGLLKFSQLPRSGSWMKKVQSLGSIVLILAGCYFIYQGLLA